MNNHANKAEEPLRIIACTYGQRNIKLITRQIENQLPTDSKLIVVGKKGTELVMTGLIRIKRKRGRVKTLVKEDSFSRASLVIDDRTELSDSTFMALDHLQRRTDQITWRGHKLYSTYNSKHYYHIISDMLANLLEKERINLALFFDLPHLYYDTIIYQIARSKGIRTLIISYSHFQNRFFSLNAIENLGKFPLVCNESSEVPYPIDPHETPQWHYMKDIKQYQGELGSLCWRGVLRLFFNLLAVEPKQFLKPKMIFDTIKRMRKISSALPKWRYPFLRYFHTSHLDYFEKILTYENSIVDYNEKFVYFPLHFQPELTTSTLGDCYSDQVLAIEQLSIILPDDCWIYVKENPKQTGAMRGSQFFRRLNRISKLKILPSYANSHELIDQSIFIATITSTVGWEAICRGKIALVFGKAWYRNLPGVVQFHQHITYETICNTEIDHSNLELQSGRLFSRSNIGDPWPPNSRSTHGNSEKVNTDAIANSIVDLVENRIETTFVQT